MMTESKPLLNTLVVAMVFASGRLMHAKSFTNAMMLFAILIVIVVSAVPDIDLDASAPS